MSVFKTSNAKANAVKTVERFKRNEEGNFATLAGLSLMVFLGCLAVGVDIANGQSAKSRLQNTTDAVALIAAKSTDKSQKELDEAAKDYFALKFPGADGSRINIKEVRREGDAVTVVAENNIDAYFSRVFGKESLDIGAESTAIFAQKAMDVAFVLDTTYSMNGSKISSLKKAATNLVETIEDQKNDNVRLSVIPFAHYINVGTSRRNAVWLDVPADETRTRTRSRRIPGGKCVTKTRTVTDDGVSRRVTYQSCQSERYKQTYTTTWKGCVGSRLSPWNERADYSGKKIPGLLGADSDCGTEILPLTNKMSNVKKTISKLNATNRDFETYMPAGLAWGWRALENDEPLTEASKQVAGVKKSEKVLVLMTDGENTKSKSGIFHNKGDTKQANKTTEALCESIKASEIQVYTIAYEVKDNTTRSLLENCASSKTMYFDAKNSNDLNAAFEAIGAALNELRITA